MLPAWMIDQVTRRKSDDDAVLHDSPPNLPPNHRDDRDDVVDDYVLNAGSGGGPSPPPAPDPMAEARAQMQLEAERARIAEENRVKQEERDAIKLANDKAAFQGRLQGAYSQAQDYGSSRLRNLGIDDTYGIMSSYETSLNKARGNVPELDPTPASYFGTSLFDEALSGARQGQRSKLTRGYEAEVPQGFETTYIPDTADDALIEAIIGEQFGEAGDYIQRARGRGTLNETGYNTANRALQQQRAGAVARANEMGAGVLGTGRQQLLDIDKKARAGLTNWDFNDTFDANSYANQIKTGAGSFSSGLEGRLRNAFGSTEFFDPDAFIAKGGKAQGAVNPGASALQDAITEEERRRTAGSVGAF